MRRIKIDDDGTLWLRVPECFKGKGVVDGMVPVGSVREREAKNPIIVFSRPLGARVVREIADSLLVELHTLHANLEAVERLVDAGHSRDEAYACIAGVAYAQVELAAAAARGELLTPQGLAERAAAYFGAKGLGPDEGAD